MATQKQPDGDAAFTEWCKKHQGVGTSRIHAKLDKFSGNTPNAAVGAAAKELADLIWATVPAQEKKE
jgi:hypothetical protein